MNVHMRTAITNSMIVGSIIFAVGCTGKKDEAASAPATASTPAPAVEEAKPADPWEGTASIKPVFPDRMSSDELKLNYATFEFNGKGLNVTPMPPNVGKLVEVKLLDSAVPYTLRAGRSKCLSKLKVAYGSGDEKLLDPKISEELKIEAADFSGSNELIVKIGLEDGAPNNWSCSVLIRPAS